MGARVIYMISSVVFNYYVIRSMVCVPRFRDLENQLVRVDCISGVLCPVHHIVREIALVTCRDDLQRSRDGARLQIGITKKRDACWLLGRGIAARLCSSASDRE